MPWNGSSLGTVLWDPQVAVHCGQAGGELRISSASESYAEEKRRQGVAILLGGRKVYICVHFMVLVMPCFRRGGGETTARVTKANYCTKCWQKVEVLAGYGPIVPVEKSEIGTCQVVFA